nr:zinc dependent phospholipase C family protein [uncultured Caproiciproducens sp.]
MPAAITHYFQAQRVWETLKEQGSKFELNKDAFLWGAQGPDFLYCHRYLPWQRGDSLKEYAEKLHLEKPSKTLAIMREYFGMDNHNTLKLSYIYGFLCHYSLDRICHPFIQYGAQTLLRSNPEQGEDILHNQIESALDVIILRYEKAALPVEFNLKRTVPKNAEVQTGISELYAYLLNRMFDLKDSGSMILQATNDCRFVFGLLNDRTTLKQAIAERIEKGDKRFVSCHFRGISEGDEYDYANVLHDDWNWPLGSENIRNESFLELYEDSVLDSMGLIGSFLETDDYDKMTNNILFI